MEIGAEEFGDCRGVRIQQAIVQYRSNPPTYISSSGEMKMSLKLMTCGCSADRRISSSSATAYVLMLEMLQQLQLAVCSLRQDRRAEGFHDLLHRNRLSGELVLRRAVRMCQDPLCPSSLLRLLPDEPEGSHADRLQVSVSTAQSVCLSPPGRASVSRTCL